MCPTLLGQAHERNGIFVEFGIEFDKKFDNGFDKPIWEKMPTCGYSRPQEVFMRQFYLGKTSSGYYKAYFIDPVTGIRDYGKRYRIQRFIPNLMSESLIKRVTGEDSLTARFLYGEYFSFKPTFKIFMATNHKTKIRGADNVIWRRIKMIPFDVTIPPEQRDKNLTEKLIAENAGILNWLIQGYAMWKKEGFGDADAVSKANEEYRMDAVGTFVNDCLEIDGSLSWRLHTKILYESYIKWCNKNNARVMSQKWLGLRMSEKGFKRLCTNGQRVWLGLSVKVEWRGEEKKKW